MRLKAYCDALAVVLDFTLQSSFKIRGCRAAFKVGFKLWVTFVVANGSMPTVTFEVVGVVVEVTVGYNK